MRGIERFYKAGDYFGGSSGLAIEFSSMEWRSPFPL